MAKSLRSKHKRKMRAVKRVRYGKKELEKLKQVVGAVESNGDVVMEEVSQLYTVVDKKPKKEPKEKKLEPYDSTRIKGRESLKFNHTKQRTESFLRDDSGNLPVWVSSHRRKRIISQEKKAKKLQLKNMKATRKLTSKIKRKKNKKNVK